MLCNSGNSDQCFWPWRWLFELIPLCLLNNQQWFSGNQASFPPLVGEFKKKTKKKLLLLVGKENPTSSTENYV